MTLKNAKFRQITFNSNL